MQPIVTDQQVVLHGGTVGGAGTTMALRLALNGLSASLRSHPGRRVRAIVPSTWHDPAPPGITLVHRSKLAAIGGELLGRPAADVVIGFADRLPLQRTPHGILVIQNPHLSLPGGDGDFGWATRLKFRVLRVWTRRSIRQASQIVCSTVSSRAALVHHFGADPTRIRVQPIPADVGSVSAGPSRAAISRIVSIGDRYGYKRVDVAIASAARFARSVNRPVEFRHIGAVRDDRAERLIDAAIISAVDSGLTIQLLGALSHDDTLVELAAGDVALFTSTIETQGIPLAEALALGVPVVARPLKAFIDVGGEAVTFAASEPGRTSDPRSSDDRVDIDAFASALMTLDDQERRDEMSRRGRCQVAPGSSWDLLGDAPDAG